MTELKCPICERDMVFIESPDGFDVFVCTNSKCKCCGYAGKNIWEHIADTKKKLDLAITELKNVVEDDDFDIYMRQLSALTTLEQINDNNKG